MPKPTKADTIQAFAETLPDTSALEPQAGEYWNRLRVWRQRVLDERIQDTALVGRRLKSLGKGLLQALCLWTGLAPETTTTAASLESLQGKISADPSQVWVQDLFLLQELLQGKGDKAIEAMGRVMLPESTVRLIESGAFTANARRLAYAMQVYYQAPEDLALLALFEQAERSGYARHTLVPREGDGAELAAQRIQEGAELSALTVPLVNGALQALEGKRSICARILPESDGSVLVFIYRMLREASIPEIDRTLFGDEVETIVMRFRDRLKFMEERSTRRAAVPIAGAIASHLLEAEVRYVADTSQSAQQALNGLLEALTKNEDDRLRLVEINLRQSPLEGSPTLVVRCGKSHSLAPTIEALQKKQVSLLEELHDVNHLGVAFDRIVGEKKRPYIFKLRLEPVDDSYLVRYSCGRLPSQLRNQFEHHLEERYDVKAIPTT